MTKKFSLVFKKPNSNTEEKGSFRTTPKPNSSVTPVTDKLTNAATSPPKPAAQPVSKSVTGGTSQEKPKFGLKFKNVKKTIRQIPAKEQKRDLFFGTGITKRKREQIARKADNDQKILDEAEVNIADIAAEREKERIIDLQVTTPTEIKLDPSQVAAVNGFVNNKYAVLIGAAGTGKTTTTKAIVEKIISQMPIIPTRLTLPQFKQNQLSETESGREVLKSEMPAIAFCAYTGRAVSMLKKAIPKEYWHATKTIHALLGFHPEYYVNDEGDQTMRFVPAFHAGNKLPYKAVFVDEVGMLAIPLWEDLLAALRPDCRIYFIGDINQLPPVHGRSVLGFAMLQWPTFELTKIHRQAADNPIIANAHNVLEGRFPTPDTDKKFNLAVIDSGSYKAEAQVLMAIKQLSKAGIFDPVQDAIITPTNKQALGQLNLNEKLMNFFNPHSKRVMIATGTGTQVLAVGDKIMLLENDSERELTNGMIGWVRDIHLNGDYKGTHVLDMDAMKSATIDPSLFDTLNLDSATMASIAEEEKREKAHRQASHVCVIDFMISPTETVEVTFKTSGDYAKMSLAYAFTCHKSQGGEYRNVIIIAHSYANVLNNREWLYTAITRAQERVFIFNNNRGLAQCINNQRIKGKTLAAKAKMFNELSKDKNTIQPTLPDPQEI